MSDQYDEIELIRRIQKGDESALWQKARKFDPSKSITLKGYLGALARNTAINEKKKYISDFQINDEVIGNIPDDFNRAELRLLLTDALRKLNKDEQLILVLFYFQNEKINDISRMTGIPASTVKSRLKRCREKMKRFLEEESYMSYTIIKADEELPPAEAPSDAVWERAPLIKSHKNVDTPNTITEFAVTGDSGRYTTPEIIFGNNDLVIFEKEDGAGWKLDKGETLVFQAHEYKSELHREKGQSIYYFYIRDGVILKGNVLTGLNQTFELTAENAGEYYVCLLNTSSDPISLKEGSIVIK